MTSQRYVSRLFRPFLPGVLGCLAAGAGVLALSAVAQDAPSPRHATPAGPVPAHVRFWKTDLRSFANLRVVIVSTSARLKQHMASRALGNAGPGYVFDNYVDVPAGPGTISAFNTPAPMEGAKGPEPQPLVRLSVDLAPGSFVTVLLAEPLKAGAPPQLEVIVDTADDAGQATPVAVFTVRSLVPGLKDMRVTLGDALSAQFGGGGSYLQMCGLQPALYPVRTLGTGLDGKPFEWTTEADLRQHLHQTLLIYPDPYGRVRPRLSVDGENPPSPQQGPNGQR